MLHGYMATQCVTITLQISVSYDYALSMLPLHSSVMSLVHLKFYGNTSACIHQGDVLP